MSSVLLLLAIALTIYADVRDSRDRKAIRARLSKLETQLEDLLKEVTP